MTTETNRIGYSPSLQTGTEWFRPLYRLVSRIGEFFEAARVARTVQNRAARYYAMSSAQLAEIGLTREQIPAALAREFERTYR